MARKITPSQLRSQLRQAQSKQKRAVDKYNQEVRQHKRKVDKAVNQYNSEVRRHNARVRVNRRKIASELKKLRSGSTTVRYQTLRSSTLALNTQYENLELREQEFDDFHNGAYFLDLSEKENANSLEASNVLESDEASASEIDPSELVGSEITDELNSISTELDNRWRGALFSLNPSNPDAARHFCTSAREVFVQILEIRAPDDAVLARDPECEKTDGGIPTRKSKIKYILVNAGIVNDAAVDFVDEDVKNVLQLFRIFNDGTHGSSSRCDLNKLLAIKTRVESGIVYLSTICSSG